MLQTLESKRSKVVVESSPIEGCDSIVGEIESVQMFHSSEEVGWNIAEEVVPEAVRTRAHCELGSETSDFWHS